MELLKRSEKADTNLYKKMAVGWREAIAKLNFDRFY
jgi:hypothetical protein